MDQGQDLQVEVPMMDHGKVLHPGKMALVL